MQGSFTFFVRVMVSVVLMTTGLDSCRKWVDTRPPQDQATAAGVFSDDNNATLAILGLYTQIMDNRSSLFNGAMSIYGGLSAGELMRTVPSAIEDAFTQHALTDINPACNSLYTSAYNWIYLCNNILEQLEKAQGVTLKTKSQLQGEAMFSRALIFFYLTNLYGDVPLVETTDFVKNATLGRAARQKVYEGMVRDLLAAQQLLQPAYMVADNAYAGDRTRPNRATATALLARVYCYRQAWAEAEQQASRVIDDTNYVLAATPGEVFHADSREAIWQLQPVNVNGSTAEAGLFMPVGGAAGRPIYALTAALLGSFEQGDLRLTQWVGTATTGNHYSYPLKYRANMATVMPAEYDMVLRLAEQYLIRAEARARLGDKEGAVEDLNKIRRRAGLGEMTTGTVTDLIAAVAQERRVEFFAEWGHRWLDLKRMGMVTTKDSLYPIPYAELMNNAQLVQNPGY